MSMVSSASWRNRSRLSRLLSEAEATPPLPVFPPARCWKSIFARWWTQTLRHTWKSSQHWTVTPVTPGYLGKKHTYILLQGCIWRIIFTVVTILCMSGLWHNTPFVELHQQLCVNIKKHWLYITNYIDNILYCSHNILCFECKDRIVISLVSLHVYLKQYNTSAMAQTSYWVVKPEGNTQLISNSQIFLHYLI